MLARLFAQRHDRDAWARPWWSRTSAAPAARSAPIRSRRRAPDGHTLLFHNITFTTTTSSLLFAKRARHDFDDFVPVSVGAYVPLLLLAHPSVPAKDLKEFVAYAKQTSTPLFYGSTGPGSIMHLMGEVLKRDTGIKMDHVPFRGAAPLVTELLSGRIQFGGDQLSSSLERVRTGQLKPMAVATKSVALPDVPDGARTGLPQSGTAGLERLPRAQGHARRGGRAPQPGDRRGRQASGRGQAHDRGRRRAVRLDARPKCATCCRRRSPRSGRWWKN